MDKFLVHRMKIFSGMLVLFIVFSACNLGSFNSDQDEIIEGTVTPGVSQNTNSDLSSDLSEVDEPEVALEMVTFYKLDGTEEVVPRTYTSFSDLLDAQVEKGEWTQGEGLVYLLQYFLGELEGDLPELEFVKEINGTGILRLAKEYIANNPSDTANIQELNRLIAQLKPSDEMLDLMSQPANSTSDSGTSKNAMLNKQVSAEDCANFQQLGFDPDHFNSEYCYKYEEAMVNGKTYRVYYPSWWQGDETKKPVIDNSIIALIDSAVTFVEYGYFYDINMIISLTTYPELTNALGIQHPISGTETCPITLFKTVGGMPYANFQQTIAHEAFHCFQDWNTSYDDYDANKWWVEGSAEFFSNVVYEDTNYEHEYLTDFDQLSVRTPIDKMSYENFIFFQHLSNEYGAKEVINLLKLLGNSNGSNSTLASFGNMADTFQDFVVAYMSTGILDTGGGMISVGNPTVVKTEVIDKEEEKKFNSHPFVATRYRMNYKKEKRFLQTPKEDGTGKYSTAENKIRNDISNWSALPPEIRSECEDDVLYVLVTTTTEVGETYELIANIDKMEKAECDPCLLGVWAVNNPSYEEFLLRLFNSQGSLEGFPPGTQIVVDVEGKYYMEFKEERELKSRRYEFSITMGASGFPGFTTTIDSQGIGKYSTQDGKKLDVFDHLDTVNQVKGSMDGLPISVTMMPGSGTASMFGVTGEAPGLENDNAQDSVTWQYQCDEESIQIEDPVYGELLFDRVEEIVPTPVPTAGS